MTLVSLGDMAQSFMLRRQNAALKAQLQTLSTEVTTGIASDTGRQTRGDLAPLSAIDASLSRLDAYGAATSESGLFTEAMQTALSTIEEMAAEFGPALLQTAESSLDVSISNIGNTARQKFETTIATLNARVGDRSLFAGQATNGPALANSETILAALDTAILGAVSATDVATAISTWFDDPAGYASVAYQGDASLSPLAIAAGESAEIKVTAMDPAVRETLKGFAMAAMLDRGALAGSPESRADLARLAGEKLVGTATDRAYLAADLGVVEGQIESAKARNGAETTALQIARLGIVSVDPYDTATKLESTQTQLETLYTITARLSRLSLMDFLR
ncbi:flagellin [Rhodobacter ferrooxidans]|uniref:Flagellar hook-associated protein FlgL family protein n=1 Tax=Rhodobacter ferrooxidans TaxID=371731 RepID=C8RX45_9RHOB|nr:flagellin [Rhodobacter sp. SW2]EEW26570.1 flagellar hook-associated protein FlgL family protein [Rhodobacter sp. SW2]